MKTWDFMTTEDNGQFKVKKNNHYWEVEKGSALITGQFNGEAIIEFSSKPIQTKYALVDWVIKVFY